MIYTLMKIEGGKIVFHGNVTLALCHLCGSSINCFSRYKCLLWKIEGDLFAVLVLFLILESLLNCSTHHRLSPQRKKKKSEGNSFRLEISLP